MADIELVIKIAEGDYHRITSGFGQEEDAVLLEKILKNGTPLPKHHGDLKDVDTFSDGDTLPEDPGALNTLWNSIYNSETIIPATKEGDEE